MRVVIFMRNARRLWWHAFNFAWEGAAGLTEIGRHKAVVTLAYGAAASKNTHAIAYFWVIPVKITLLTLLGVALFIAAVIWMVRLYVRRILVLAGVNVTPTPAAPADTTQKPATHYRDMLRPAVRGIADLRQHMHGASKIIDVCATLGMFIVQYKRFFIALLILSIGFVALVYFIAATSTEHKSYEVTIKRDDGDIVVDSETILKEKLATTSTGVVNSDQHFTLHLINASGEAGVAATIAQTLESHGYVVHSLDTADAVRTQTVIIYNDTLDTEALALSSTLNNVLVSAIAAPHTMASSTVQHQNASIVGEDWTSF